MIKTFDEVFEDVTKYGTKVKTDEYHANGANIIIDQGQEQIAGYTDLEDGLFTSVPALVFGDHTRVVKYVDEPFFLGADGVKVLRCKYTDANYRYLYYALKSIRIPNTGYNRHFKWLKDSEIEYPNNGEQCSIVTILDKVSGIIDARTAELQKFDSLIKARFIEMFGDPKINPKGWKKEPLNDHALVLVGYPFPSERYASEGIAIVGGYNLMQGYIQWDESKHWHDEEGYDQYLLQANDIVMAMDRPWVNGGFKIARVDATHLPALLIQRTACIRGIDLEQEFLHSQLDTQRFAEHCNITGSLVPHISNKDINTFPVIIPPIEEQRRFTAFVSQVDKSKTAVQKALDKAQLLFDSLMQKYFG